MADIKYLDSSSIKKIHLIGIGGISMSGLAGILMKLGYEISGSDLKETNLTLKLKENGASIYSGHNGNHIENPDLVVYTAAVKEDNPELVRALNLGIPAIDRATLLGEIMGRYPYSIAISGTHGKTTTTSMIAMIAMEAGINPTVHIGGELPAIHGNTRIGGNRYFISEACEYVESFLKLHPYIAVILNIEADHLDYFKDIEQIKQAFLKFTGLVKQDGFIVACTDDGNINSLLDKIQGNVITYGLNTMDAVWTARDIVFDNAGFAKFSMYRHGKDFAQIKLNVPGLHNVSNALAAAAACSAIGCSAEAISCGLSDFTGASRRFEFKGMVDGIRVVDDYAHHPTEIRATLRAARSLSQTKIYCVFQPHTYTRTKALLDEFVVSFGDADTVIISDIYAAREKDTGEIHAVALAEKLRINHSDAQYISTFESIAEYLADNAEPGSLIITMGAGDIFKAGEMFLERKAALERAPVNK